MGSGRAICESCISIDVRRWNREGRLHAGHSFTCSWTLGGKPFGSSRSALAQADDRADEILVFARGLEGFAPLAERSRYAIAESRTGVVSEQVLLRPRATVPPSQ